MTNDDQGKDNTPAQAVKLAGLVRALVWVELSGGYFRATTNFRRYDVIVSGRVYLEHMGLVTTHDTIEAAKAAAQADFAAKSIGNIDTCAIAALVGALQPFAAYGALSGADLLPDSHVLTSGSRFAARQITMGDMRKAKHVLARLGCDDKGANDAE